MRNSYQRAWSLDTTVENLTSSARKPGRSSIGDVVGDCLEPAGLRELPRHGDMRIHIHQRFGPLKSCMLSSSELSKLVSIDPTRPTWGADCAALPFAACHRAAKRVTKASSLAGVLKSSMLIFERMKAACVSTSSVRIGGGKAKHRLDDLVKRRVSHQSVDAADIRSLALEIERHAQTFVSSPGIGLKLDAQIAVDRALLRPIKGRGSLAIACKVERLGEFPEAGVRQLQRKALRPSIPSLSTLRMKALP